MKNSVSFLLKTIHDKKTRKVHSKTMSMIMKQPIISIRLIIGASAALVGASIFAGISEHLVLKPGTAPTEVRLPFKYQTLTENEKGNLIFIPECHYTVLEKNCTKKALVGPLSPCKLVIIKNKENGKVAIFHKSDGNNTTKLCQTAEKALAPIKSPSNIECFLYAATSRYIEAINKELSERPFPYQSTHATQRDKLKFIGNKIVKFFGIQQTATEKDHDQIVGEIMPVINNASLKDYAFAQSFIIVDKDLNKTCCCPMHENAFQIPGLEKLPRKKRLRKFREELNKRENIKKVQQEYPYAYEYYEYSGFVEIK